MEPELDSPTWVSLAKDMSSVLNDMCTSIDAGKTDRNLMEKLQTLWLQDIDQFGGSVVKHRYLLVHWLFFSIEDRLQKFESDGRLGGDDLSEYRFVLNGLTRLWALNEATVGLVSDLDARYHAMILLTKKEKNICRWLGGRQSHSPKASYQHIYTSKGESLLSLASSLPEKHKNSGVKKDVLCNVCHLGGYFISCEGCPRVFHKECVHLKEIPDGEWYCRCCRYQKNNVAGTSWNDTAAGEVAGIECRRSMRLVETKESDRGGCVLCKDHDLLKEGFSHRTILLCDQCEREYHVGCLRDRGIQDLKELPQGNWFCCSGCEKINSTLQQLIEEGGQEIPDPLLTIIKGKHAAKYSEDVHSDVKWRLLSGNMCDVEQLLSDAVSIFQEQFSPIVVPGSKTDLIPFMVFGKNMNKDKNYRGVYCAVLTVNSQVVSAGILRVFGTEIAELPLVATAKYCEKLGYFQALYYCIENLLKVMEVKHLSLPAANEAKTSMD